MVPLIHGEGSVLAKGLKLEQLQKVSSDERPAKLLENLNQSLKGVSEKMKEYELLIRILLEQQKEAKAALKHIDQQVEDREDREPRRGKKNFSKGEDDNDTEEKDISGGDTSSSLHRRKRGNHKNVRYTHFDTADQRMWKERIIDRKPFVQAVNDAENELQSARAILDNLLVHREVLRKQIGILLFLELGNSLFGDLEMES
jgi:hypothetical protein